MPVVLTPEELVQLKALHKQQKDKRKADRIKLILLLHVGYSQAEVSVILMLDQETITTWKNRFLARTDSSDLTTWLEDKYVPYRGRLSSQQISRVRKYLQVFTVADTAQIRNYLAVGEQINYSISGSQKLLHRIGVAYKKISRLPGKVNIVAQTAARVKLEKLAAALTPKETILFMDSVHPQHNTINSRVWIAKGTQRWLPSNTGREHLNINGAYNPVTQQFFQQQAEKITAQVTVKLLKDISANTPTFDKVYIVADNATYNKAKEVKNFLVNQAKIELIYLPPYSPNLNLIERLWKFMKERVIHLRYYSTFGEFRQAINNFFDNLSYFKEELKNRITFKFQSFAEAESR